MRHLFTLLLLALVGVALCGWASKLLWFGLGQWASGFSALINNCGSHTRGCVAGALQFAFGAICTAAGGYGTYYDAFRRSTDGTYHIFEAGHPGVKTLNTTVYKRAEVGLDARGRKEALISVLKRIHLGLDNEAKLVFHHKDGAQRLGRYHFNNATQYHHLHTSFSTDKTLYADGGDEGDLQARYENVNGNTGMGVLFNDEDAGTWSNVDHANNDIAYWVDNTLDQMENNDADSFCMGFHDPDNGDEHVGAMRAQPARDDNYGGVTFNPCGSDNFRKKRSPAPAPAPAPALEIKPASPADIARATRDLIRLEQRKMRLAQMSPARRASILEEASDPQKRLSCEDRVCDDDSQCDIEGCGNYYCAGDYTCSYQVIDQPHCRRININC